jgi:hypothetical protein
MRKFSISNLDLLLIDVSTQTKESYLKKKKKKKEEKQQQQQQTTEETALLLLNSK